MKSKGRQLKELLAAPEILIAPGVFDGFSARLAASRGYRTAIVSGAGLSESRLGWPDRGIMGFEENLNACWALADCTELLLQADADTGYGNAINVAFTVRAFEKAGLAAVMIEDQVWPKRCGHLAGKEVIAAEEMVQKIKAAVDARTDPDFVIKARTDAAGVLGIDEAIRRLNLYAEAGADCLFADALLSEADIEKVARSVSRPLNVNMGFGIRSRPTTPLIPAKRLEAMGVAQISYPRMLTGSAVRGMMNALDAFESALMSGETIDRPDLAVGFEELNRLMGIEAIEEMDRAYATPSTETKSPTAVAGLR